MELYVPPRSKRLLCGLCTAVALIGTSACAPDDEELPQGGDSGTVMQFVEAGVGAEAGGPAQPDGGSSPIQQPDAAVFDAGASFDAAVLDSSSTPEPDATDEENDGGDTDADIDEEPVDAQRPQPDAAVDAGREDAGGSTGNATPSAGCGKGQRPAGGRVSVSGSHNFTFPADYDGKRPFPLLVGFHAAGNPIEQIENLTKGSALEQGYVRAFPKSKGSAWDYNTDIAKVRSVFQDLLANYCIDTSRVFATGHSSGAQMIAQILTPARKADADLFNFRAVAPVAASRYGAVSRTIAVLYIQGSRDTQRGNSDGADVVKEFVTANGCSSTTKPFAGPTCMSSGKTVNDGCRQYDGCKAPTLWCSHDDPAYSNTNHGWPCFATKAIADFFATLR